MIDSSYILWWILCAIVGGAIGHAKEQVSAGVILGALLGPLGVIITLFLSDPKVQKAIDRNRAIIHEQRQRMLEVRQQQALESETAFTHAMNQMRLQNQQAPTPRVISRGPVAQCVPPPPMAKAAIQSFRIASNGQELGEIALPVIRTMMSAGRLLETDHYFDPVTGEWRTLDQLKEGV
jgi:hypothetical protein